MKIKKWTMGVALLAFGAGPALAQQSIETAFSYDPSAVQTPAVAPQQSLQTAFNYDPSVVPAPPAAPQPNLQTAFNYNLAEEDDAPAAEEPAKADCGCADDASCGCEEPACGCEEPACGCEPSCGCDNGWSAGSCLGECCLDDACTLQDNINPCCDHKYGGWLSMGYYSDNDRLSFQPNDLLSFGDNPDNVNLDQAWVWFEKKAEAGACSGDWGYRFDMLYGVDAQKTQAFGNENPIWDVTFDHGSYGWAMPQAYGEYATGDWTFQAGHFYTLIGYEVVQASEAFFYSHSLQMFNSEPFTHTGALAAYQLSEEVSLHGGWTLGWDTGFDQFGGGSNFLGGIDAMLNDDINFIYMLSAGNFGFRSANQDGYSHSVVFDVDLSENLNYVMQSDYVNANGYNGDASLDNEDIGITNYLFYFLNDCWAVGGRQEWWKSNSVTGESASFYEITGGVNYRPHANLVFRPEVKYNWTPSEQSVNPDYNDVLFAMDAVITF